MQYMNLRNEDVFNKVRTLTAVALQFEIEDVQDSRIWLESHFANPATHLDSLYNDGGGQGWDVAVSE